MNDDIKELKKRAGIDEQRSDKMKAWMDAKTMVAMMEDLEAAAMDGMISPKNMGRLKERAMVFARKMEELTRG